MTVRCLESLFNTTVDEPREVIVIDDGSPVPFGFVDDTDLVQRLETIHRETNGGYSAAVNTGLYYATEDIIIVGNNDLIFTDNWLEGLLWPIAEGFDISTVWTSDQKDIKIEEDIEPMAKFGSLFAMKRSVYETLGGFDQQFRGYFTDLDYRRRALEHGFTIGKNLSCVVKHIAKATYKQTDPTDSEFIRASRLYEAKWGEID
jgi:GT2 family glycosyltransferase